MNIHTPLKEAIPAVAVPEGSSGPWRIERFTVTEQEARSFRSMMLAGAGRGIEPGTYTKLVHKRRGIVMSDTPAERRDHMFFVNAATGHVLINGLGIGMCLNAVLQKPDVTKVTVVELDEDVIALSGPHYLADPRVEIVHCSAYDYQPPKGVRYGAVWHDVWDDICSDNYDAMKSLHRKYARRADWQGSWSRPEVERIVRSERRFRDDQ